jgi:hypothetical protein
VTRRAAHREATATEPLVNLNARVRRQLWRRVRLQCLQENRLLRSFVTEALEDYLRGQSRH